MATKKKTPKKNPQRQVMMVSALRKGNSMYDYGNHTKGGIHVTHWKPRQSYGGSNAGGASVGGGS